MEVPIASSAIVKAARLQLKEQRREWTSRAWQMTRNSFGLDKSAGDQETGSAVLPAVVDRGSQHIVCGPVDNHAIACRGVTKIHSIPPTSTFALNMDTPSPLVNSDLHLASSHENCKLHEKLSDLVREDPKARAPLPPRRGPPPFQPDDAPIPLVALSVCCARPASQLSRAGDHFAAPDASASLCDASKSKDKDAHGESSNAKHEIAVRENGPLGGISCGTTMVNSSACISHMLLKILWSVPHFCNCMQLDPSLYPALLNCRTCRLKDVPETFRSPQGIERICCRWTDDMDKVTRQEFGSSTRNITRFGFGDAVGVHGECCHAIPSNPEDEILEVLALVREVDNECPGYLLYGGRTECDCVRNAALLHPAVEPITSTCKSEHIDITRRTIEEEELNDSVIGWTRADGEQLRWDEAQMLIDVLCAMDGGMHDLYDEISPLSCHDNMVSTCIRLMG